jgi:hypothetical protein
MNTATASSIQPSEPASDTVAKPAGSRWEIAVAALAGAATAFACARGIPGIGAMAPYPHMRYAQQLWASGMTLRGHPFLPYSILGTSGVDLWWGFHVALIPFTSLGVINGGRAAGITIAAVAIGSFAWWARRAGQRHPLPFALIPLVGSGMFVFRDHLAQPSHLTVPLVLVGVAAGAGVLKPRAAGIAAFLHSLFHMSVPLSPLFTTIGLTGGAFGTALESAPGERLKSFLTSLRRNLDSVLYSVGGVGIGLLVRPDRLEYVATAFHQSTRALGTRAGFKLPHIAPEAQPIPLNTFAAETWFAFLILVLALVQFRSKPRAGGSAIRWAALLASLCAVLMCGVATRFLDYLLPLLAVSAAVWWPASPAWLSAKRSRPFVRVAGVVGAIVAVLVLSRHVAAAHRTGTAYYDPPETFEKMAELVHEKVPKGSIIFTDDLFETGVLYSYMPEYKYLIAYDPSVLYGANPGRFWSWHHAVVDGIACDQPECPGEHPSPDAVAAVIASFNAEWVITSYPQSRFSMQSLLGHSPALFQYVAHVPGPVVGLYLWRLRYKPGGSAH